MSDIVEIGSAVPEEKPNYINYLYKQFARDLQGRIVKYLANTKVYVEVDQETDSAKITFTNKPTGYVWETNVSGVMQKIATEAEGIDQTAQTAKEIYGMYKDHIWHLFFYDFKKRRRIIPEDIEPQLSN